MQLYEMRREYEGSYLLLRFITIMLTRVDDYSYCKNCLNPNRYGLIKLSVLEVYHVICCILLLSYSLPLITSVTSVTLFDVGFVVLPKRLIL